MSSYDGEFYVQNKKLKKFILNAKEGLVKEYHKTTGVLGVIKKILLALLILFIVGVIIEVVHEQTQEGIIEGEIAKIADLDYTKEDIDMTIYADVEKAIKEYYVDF